MEWLDRVNRTTSATAGPPPKTGKGSGRQAWATYAGELGYDVGPDATRAQIIAMVESGPPRGANRKALEDQLEAMATGREHRAEIEACRSLADRIDRLEAKGRFDEKSWREYRLALKSLREAVTDGGGPDPLDELHSLRGTLRNPEDT